MNTSSNEDEVAGCEGWDAREGRDLDRPAIMHDVKVVDENATADVVDEAVIRIAGQARPVGQERAGCQRTSHQVRDVTASPFKAKSTHATLFIP